MANNDATMEDDNLTQSVLNLQKHFDYEYNDNRNNVCVYVLQVLNIL